MRGVLAYKEVGDMEPDECMATSFCSSWIICRVDEDRLFATKLDASVAATSVLSKSCCASSGLSCCCSLLLGDDGLPADFGLEDRSALRDIILGDGLHAPIDDT